MLTNRISSYMQESAASAGLVPAGFAVCQLPQFAQSPLAIQLIAQQRAYEEALVHAREEALRIALSRLTPSVN